PIARGRSAMGEIIQLAAADGHNFDVYQARPEGRPRGALLVIQEIFGVNSHMRSVADGFAADGYFVLAPALFDRAKRGFEVGYSPEDIQKGRDVRAKVTWEAAVSDMEATVDALKEHGKVGAVGYCWGGSLAWLAATRIDGLAASVGYYGGQVAGFKDEQPRCPVMLHFGDSDKSIPLTDVDAVRKAHPEVEVHVYPAGHGFNCDQRADFSAADSKVARERTLAFFAKHVG